MRWTLAWGELEHAPSAFSEERFDRT